MNGVSLSVLFLSVNTGVFIGTLAAAVVVFAALGAFVGYTIYKKNTEKKVGEAGERVRKIIGDAEAEAGQIRNLNAKPKKRKPKSRRWSSALLKKRTRWTRNRKLWNSRRATS